MTLSIKKLTILTLKTETLGIMTLSIRTLGIITLSIMISNKHLTLDITTLRIRTLGIITLSIMISNIMTLRKFERIKTSLSIKALGKAILSRTMISLRNTVANICSTYFTVLLNVVAP